MTNKVKCDECDWKGVSEELLRGENPFERNTFIYGCPNCKSIDCFTMACEIEDCWKDCTCGTLTKNGGYANTCGEHRPKAEE